jgi:hypothetical protein
MDMTTDQLITLTPAAAKRAAKDMSAIELLEVDIELGRRAALLGRIGAVTAVHKAIRNALSAR